MDAQLEDRYRVESGRLTAARSAYGALLFVGGVGLAGVLEYRYHPERVPALLLFFTLELAVCAAASVLTRSRRLRGAGIAVTFGASVALIACVTAYALFAGTNVTVMAFLFVVFELTTALVFPWGARPQAFMTATAVALYGMLVARGAAVADSAMSIAYAFYAVAAGGLVSVLGASFLDRQRFTLFVQREQLDQHLLTFRELTHAFRGFDPQRVIFLACRAAMQTFGLRWLWVTWQTVDGRGADGYLVRREPHGLHWEPLADTQPFWRWVTESEFDARASVIPGGDAPIMMPGPHPASLLWIPLQFEGERLGAICGTRDGDAFTLDPRALALASVLANAASIALANARLYQQAAAASEEKSIFLARIAHELRNPLQAILWDLETVREDPATRRAELDRVEQHALMTLDLAKELQDFAEVETKHLTMNPEPVNLAQTLDNLQATAMALLAGKPVEYRTTIGAGAELIVTDALRLRQILGNLISNAVKFTARGSIEVSARADGNEIAISVSDTGPGVPESERADIFNPFFRGTARAISGARGMGLGLAIAQDLAQLIGGRIVVDSRVGEGSSFRLVLPLPPVSDPLLRETVPDLAGKAVLVVEDDAGWRQTVAAALRAAGAEVVETPSGLAGVRLAREHGPDAIVLDLCLPDLGGVEVMERLEADASFAPVPIIVVTAERDPSTEARCRAIGCAAFITKPCDPSQLIRILGALLPSPRLARTAVRPSAATSMGMKGLSS